MKIEKLQETEVCLVLPENQAVVDFVIQRKYLTKEVLVTLTQQKPSYFYL